ncbi:MAG TPA: ABC transporter transmembrane domain-containing protein, partial [Tissierellaceae bacterium]|nr:ABC transporter transmembrane domain-containing protein [Tissierellaceae bacterium]
MKDSSIVRLLKLVKPYKGIVILSGIFALLVNGAELLKPYILKVVIDDFLVLNKAESGLYSIKAMGLLYMGATVIGSLLTYGQVNLMNYVGQEIVT